MIYSVGLTVISQDMSCHNPKGGKLTKLIKNNWIS